MRRPILSGSIFRGMQVTDDVYHVSDLTSRNCNMKAVELYIDLHIGNT